METCCMCGESAIGRALDGRQYCHRKECICWKTELQKHRDAKVTK